MIAKTFIKLTPLLAMLVLAGCGGKGVRPTASDWETGEYQAQGGLDLIKASSMYARGGTGKGVTVGLLDTGATPGHPDLTGKYVVVDSFEGVDPMDTNPEFGGHDVRIRRVPQDMRLAPAEQAGSKT